MSRARPSATGFARCAGAASLAVLAAACGGGTLDAGRNNPPSPPIGLLDNLVGHWRLDDGAGSTAAFDSSGQRNDGVVHGLDSNTAWVGGQSQGALATAHTGWVQVAHSPSIDAIVDRVTISAWVYQEEAVTAPDNFGTALSRQTERARTSTSPVVVPGAPEPVHHHRRRVRVTRRTGSRPRDTWIHLAGVWDGAVARIYVDGAEVASAPLTGSFAPDTTPVILGGNGNDASGVPTELFPGRIDELMLYARALSAEEIGRLAAGVLFPGGARDAGTD